MNGMTGMAHNTHTTDNFDQLVWPKLMFFIEVNSFFFFVQVFERQLSVSVSIFDMIIAHLFLLLFVNYDWRCHAIRLPKYSRIMHLMKQFHVNRIKLNSNLHTNKSRLFLS